MDMELSASQTLERELEDIRRKKQEFQMLEERERLVREQLEMVSSSSPIAINTARQTQQHGLSISPGCGYELASFGDRQYQPSSASARRATVAMTPRSQSNMGVSGLSARPDTNMARSRSSISALSHPMSRSVSQASNLSRASHAASSSLFPGTSAGVMDHRHSASRLPEVQEDPLPNFGQSPMDFIMSTEDEGSAFAPASFPGTHYAPAQSSDYFQYPANVLTSISSSTPSLVSVDSAAALEATPLTRDNSSIGESFVGGFELARLNSTSLPVERTASHDPLGRDLHLSSDAKQMATDNAYLFNLGTNLAGLPSQNYPDPDDAQSTEMYRSTSNTSTRSTASNQERRAKEARERQIQNGLRNGNIRPRPSSDAPDEGDAPEPMHLSQDAPKKDSRPVAGKGQYQRPKHPKVFCDKCTDHPDGFRGEHELRRHVSSKHSATVTKWVCREPSSPTGVAAVNPLSKCKACLGKKQYGAYYNAAAHLRRAHFRKKRGPRRPRVEKGEMRVEAEVERRAGKGGGDWPPMAELKHWMRKVSVRGNVIVEEEEPEAFSQEVERMTYGNGGGVDYSGLEAGDSYPSMLPELTVDTVDGPPAEGFMGGELSPFSSGASLSPLQGELGFDDSLEEFGQAVSPGVPYMEFPVMEEYGLMGGV